MAVSSKVSLTSICLSLIKQAHGLVQVDVEELRKTCVYQMRDSESGWWCCADRSIPVEIFKGLTNVSDRSYAYVRDECLSVFPVLNSTIEMPRLVLTTGVDAISAILVGFGLVVVFIAVVGVIIGVVVHRRRRRAPIPPSRASIYYRAPLIGGMNQTLSTISETREDVDFPIWWLMLRQQVLAWQDEYSYTKISVLVHGRLWVVPVRPSTRGAVILVLMVVLLALK